MSQDPDQLGRALSGFDNAQLEGLRLEFLRSGDSRLDVVLEHVVSRGLSELERRTRRLAANLPVHKQRAAIEDATARLMLRLRRLEHLPAVDVLARQLAEECVQAQSPGSSPPKLAPRQPGLRLVSDALGQELRRGRRPNHWRSS